VKERCSSDGAHMPLLAFHADAAAAAAAITLSPPLFFFVITIFC